MNQEIQDIKNEISDIKKLLQTINKNMQNMQNTMALSMVEYNSIQEKITKYELESLDKKALELEEKKKLTKIIEPITKTKNDRKIEKEKNDNNETENKNDGKNENERDDNVKIENKNDNEIENKNNSKLEKENITLNDEIDQTKYINNKIMKTDIEMFLKKYYVDDEKKLKSMLKTFHAQEGGINGNRSRNTMKSALERKYKNNNDEIKKIYEILKTLE